MTRTCTKTKQHSTYTALSVLGCTVTSRRRARGGPGGSCGGDATSSRGRDRRRSGRGGCSLRCSACRGRWASARNSKCGLQDGHIGTVGYTVGRLEAIHVIAPPRASSPPQSALPDIFRCVSINMMCSSSGRLTRVVIHVLEHICDCCLTLSVDAASELADQTDLLVVTKPLGGCNKAL